MGSIDMVENTVMHEGRKVADLTTVSEVRFRPGRSVEFVDGARRRRAQLSPFSIRNRRRRWVEFQREVILRLAELQPDALVRTSAIALRSVAIVPLCGVFGLALLADWAEFGGTRTLVLGTLLMWICVVVAVAVAVDLWRRLPEPAATVASRVRTGQPGKRSWPLGPSPLGIAFVAGLITTVILAIAGTTFA